MIGSGLVVAFPDRVRLDLVVVAIALAVVGCGRDLQSPGPGAGGAPAGVAGNGGAGAGSSGGTGGITGAGGCASTGCITDAGSADAGGCRSSDGAWVTPGETVVMVPNCSPCTCQASGEFVCTYVPCPKDGEAPRDGGVCTDHESCNEDPAISVVRGMCLERGLACHCGMYSTSPYTGRCLNPGDDGSGCEYAGTTYGVGAVVPVLGCANRCSCTAPGAITCPTGACLTCALTDDYSFNLPDGRFGSLYRPGTSLALFRTIPGSDVPRSCSVALPACGTANAVDTSDLAADIAHADVQQALAASPGPVYGDRSVTAPMFIFRRSSNGSFSIVVGRECTTSTATCEPTPPGVRRLMDDVNAAVAAGVADPICAILR